MGCIGASLVMRTITLLLIIRLTGWSTIQGFARRMILTSVAYAQVDRTVFFSQKIFSKHKKKKIFLSFNFVRLFLFSYHELPASSKAVTDAALVTITVTAGTKIQIPNHYHQFYQITLNATEIIKKLTRNASNVFKNCCLSKISV